MEFEDHCGVRTEIVLSQTLFACGAARFTSVKQTAIVTSIRTVYSIISAGNNIVVYKVSSTQTREGFHDVIARRHGESVRPMFAFCFRGMFATC
jgi:hypothetical protein